MFALIIYEIKGVRHIHNFDLKMTANGYSINDSSVLEHLRNLDLDTPMNFHTSIHSDTSNNSLRKMEKINTFKGTNCSLTEERVTY